MGRRRRRRGKKVLVEIQLEGEKRRSWVLNRMNDRAPRTWLERCKNTSDGRGEPAFGAGGSV